MRIITIGGSTGSVDAIRQLVAALPHNLPAALLVVLHIGPHRSVLPELLAGRSRLTASHAVDGEALRAGHIFVAPPDKHLLVLDGHIRLSRGPKEHHTRPAVDPLFRTAAQAYGPRVIGVVLSGTLDDGTAGLQAIKACGGIAVVQDPAEAAEPSMPQGAIRHARVDHIARADALGPLLIELVNAEEVTTMPERPASLDHEVALMLGEGEPLDHLRRLGKPSMFSCPDCHGTLWQVEGAAPQRFRCHTGHGYTARSLQHSLTAAADEALWSAMRAVQERKLLLQELHLDESTAPGSNGQQTQAQLTEDIETLRRMLERHPPEVEPA